MCSNGKHNCTRLVVLFVSLCGQLVSLSNKCLPSVETFHLKMTSLLLFIFPFVSSRPSSWEINLGSNGTLYGDMSTSADFVFLSIKLLSVLTPRQLSRYAHSGQTIRHTYRKESSLNRWSNNIVPFTLSNRYSPSQFVHSTFLQK